MQCRLVPLYLLSLGVPDLFLHFRIYIINSGFFSFISYVLVKYISGEIIDNVLFLLKRLLLLVGRLVGQSVGQSVCWLVILRIRLFIGGAKNAA